MKDDKAIYSSHEPKIKDSACYFRGYFLRTENRGRGGGGGEIRNHFILVNIIYFDWTEKWKGLEELMYTGEMPAVVKKKGGG